MELIILLAVLVAVAGAYNLGGYMTMHAFKEGLELNLQLRTKEPEDIKMPTTKPEGKFDITKLFSFDGQDKEMPTGSTDTMPIMDEWLNGPQEERR